MCYTESILKIKLKINSAANIVSEIKLMKYAD
jgi:hypothetical protein